jgi:hypothetical protein
MKYSGVHHKHHNHHKNKHHHHSQDHSQERLSSHEPLKYSSPTHHSHSQERLASHEPLKYSAPTHHNNQLSQNNHHEKKSHSPFRHSLEELERKKFSSHKPQAYSGAHSESLSNPRSYLNHSNSGSFAGSRSASHSAHSAPSRNTDKRRIPERHMRSFLESGVKVRSKKNSSLNFFKSCVTFGNYVRCKFTPEVHRTFFGVNVEEC